MSAFNAVPIRGCSTRLLPNTAATSCGAVQPMVLAQHFPPVPCCLPRPADPRTQYAVAIANRASAAAFTVPSVVAEPPKNMQNLSAGTHPKTMWGVFW